MQNKYVGDVGDFGKYGLLRALCGKFSGQVIRLGVVWYLVPNEKKTNDGGMTSYLQESSTSGKLLRRCDPDLFALLGSIVNRGVRSVESIARMSVLPRGTIFYAEPLTFEHLPWTGPESKAVRLAHRAKWLTRALDGTQTSNLVFFDPDNGLEVKVKPHQKKGPKYAYYDELMPFYERGQSLVIYQHIHRKRNETAEIQVDQRLRVIRERIGNADTFALLYHRGTARAFFVVPSRDHQRMLLERAQEFVRGPWGQFEHFELILPGR